MGEAKARKIAQTAAIMSEVALWTAPVSEEERAMVERVKALPFETVRRAPQAQMAYMRMEPQQCHFNCQAYAKLDPEGKAVAVTGWWKLDDLLVAHSVVARDGGMMCITPHQSGEMQIEFAPDPAVEWVRDGERFRPTLSNGDSIPRILRINPDRITAYGHHVVAQIESGMKPLEAMKIDYRTFDL